MYYEGRPCKNCKSTRRYITSRGCIACTNTKATSRSKTAEAKACSKEYYQSNKIIKLTKTKERYIKDPIARDLQRKRCRDWAKKNKARHAANVRKYQARKLQATPAWANLKEVEQIYIDCDYISRLTNTPHHVDHIIPLKGKLVCGLHVTNNLQILPAKDNISKGNRI